MQMNVRDDRKTVEIWLTRSERDNPGLRESLKPLYRQYKEKHYLVALFLSGEEELYRQTRDLLLYNRRRAAERAVGQGKRSNRTAGAAEVRGTLEYRRGPEGAKL